MDVLLANHDVFRPLSRLFRFIGLLQRMAKTFLHLGHNLLVLYLAHVEPQSLVSLSLNHFQLLLLKYFQVLLDDKLIVLFFLQPVLSHFKIK